MKNWLRFNWKLGGQHSPSALAREALQSSDPGPASSCCAVLTSEELKLRTLPQLKNPCLMRLSVTSHSSSLADSIPHHGSSGNLFGYKQQRLKEFNDA